MPVTGAAPHAWLAVTPPVGPTYSLVLVAHVAAAVVGFGSVGVTGLLAVRARHGPQSPDAEAVRRFFRAPVNWPSRAIYLVPMLGAALLGLSRGTFDVDDHFVVVGLLVWTLSVVVAETVVWPAERRVVAVVSTWGTDADAAASLGSTVAAAPASPASGPAAAPASGPAATAGSGEAGGAGSWAGAGSAAFDGRAFERDCRLLELGSVLLVVLFVVTSWVMIVKP